jgi:aldehyde dehydrogenase (NAD+)
MHPTHQPISKPRTDPGPLQDPAAAVAALRDYFESGRTLAYAWRMEQLGALLRMLACEEGAIIDALRVDLGKPRIEAWAAEINSVANDVKLIRKNLRRWMRPERVSAPLVVQPAKAWVHREPYGVALVIAPWNYPIALSLDPLAGAIAAGNVALLKPSEVAPVTSALLARIVGKYLDPAAVAVIEGGVRETTLLLEQRFDYIFYTGNGRVGRIVMRAAAKHLTPLALELGGKSPCIVDVHTDLKTAARRIVWAKFFNCGQTCVAPDYVLAHDKVHDSLLDALTECIRSFWGERPQESADYGRIINAHHYRRLMSLLPGSGDVVIGGSGDEAARYIAPTVLANVAGDAPVMQEEIFGPLLPVLRVADVADATRFINRRPKPLALYAFTSDRRTEERIVESTSSGSVVINHALLQLAVPTLPFGGVGASGMGAYHGRASFEAFGRRRAVLKKSIKFDPPLIYPPYTRSSEAWIKRLA